MTLTTHDIIVKMFEEDCDKYNDESFELTFDVIDEYAARFGYEFDEESDLYYERR